MSNKKQQIPAIRFNGFTDAWEQRKFSQYYKVSSGFAFKLEDYTEIGVPIVNGESIQHGVVSSNKFNYLPDSFRNKYPQYVLNTGDIVLGLNRPVINGELKIAKIPEKLDKSLLYQRAGKVEYIRPISKKFSFILLDKEILKYTLKEAVGSDQPFISTTKLAEWKMFVPSSNDEMEKLGIFFNLLNNAIALHQRQLDNYKELKKSMLQKVLPQEEEKVPEIRFDGFTGDWEQRKLGEIAEITSGGTPSTNVKEYWEGDIDWYSPVEIGKERYVFSSQRKITEFGLKKSSAKILPANKTILFTSRAGIGDMAILMKEGATNQGFQSLVLNERYDIYFVYSMGNKIKEFALKNAAGSTFLEISGKGLAKMELLIPTLEEQTIIGSFFKNIDDAIELHKRKVLDYQQLKKAMLQQMFV